MQKFQEARLEMVERQLRRRGVRDERVLAAMAAVPREAFVEPGFENEAYEDRALPIREGQTISQPYIVALMAQAAALTPDSRVLEVGGGSGYAAAVLGRLARMVFVLERKKALVRVAIGRWAKLGYRNIEARWADGSLGWPEKAPFDAILVPAGAPEAPEALKAQLAPGGALIVPVGPRGGQRLRRIRRVGEAAFAEEDLAAVAFVPLVSCEEAPRSAAQARFAKGSDAP